MQLQVHFEFVAHCLSLNLMDRTTKETKLAQQQFSFLSTNPFSSAYPYQSCGPSQTGHQSDAQLSFGGFFVSFFFVCFLLLSFCSNDYLHRWKSPLSNSLLTHNSSKNMKCLLFVWFYQLSYHSEGILAHSSFQRSFCGHWLVRSSVKCLPQHFSQVEVWTFDQAVATQHFFLFFLLL